MSPALRTSLRIGFVVLVAAPCCYCGWEWVRFRRSSRMLQEAQGAHDRLHELLRNRKLAEAALAKRRALDQERLRATAAARLRPSPKDGSYSDASDEVVSKDAATRRQLQKAYLESYRGSLASEFSLLFQWLHLSPDQQAKLTDLLAQREANNLEVAEAALAKGVDESDPSIQALDDSLSRANKQAMIDLLGKTATSEVREFLHARTVLPELNEIIADAATVGAPLTSDQSLNILKVLAGSSQQQPSGLVIDNTVNWPEAEARAQPYLNAEQAAVFQTVRQEQENSQQVSRMAAALNAQP